MLFVPHGKCIGLKPDFWGIWIQKKIWKGSLLAGGSDTVPSWNPSNQNWFCPSWDDLPWYFWWETSHQAVGQYGAVVLIGILLGWACNGITQTCTKKIPQSDICLVFAGSTENSHFVAYTGPRYLFMTNFSSTSQFWVGQKPDSKPARLTWRINAYQQVLL